MIRGLKTGSRTPTEFKPNAVGTLWEDYLKRSNEFDEDLDVMAYKIQLASEIKKTDRDIWNTINGIEEEAKDEVRLEKIIKRKDLEKAKEKTLAIGSE